MTAINWALRLFLGGLFVYAGVVKVLDPAQFLIDIESYRLLPYVLAVATAFYLPWLEILCGAGLWNRRTRTGSLLILIGLTVVFAVLITSAWARGLNISCGCFGVSDTEGTNYLWWLTRDILIFLGLAAAFVLDRPGFVRDRLSRRPQPGPAL